MFFKVYGKTNSQILLRQVYNQRDDFYTVIDAVSLYHSALWKYAYPIGKPYFEPDTEKLRYALNSCDANFPLGFVDCEVHFRDPNIICPLLATKKGDRLRNTAESVHIFPSKTTIDIMEAVKYNKATVSQVFKALLFPDKIPIFCDTIRIIQ